MGSKYVGLRMAIGALCFVGGFIFPLLFIPALIIGWSLTATPAERHEAQRPQPEAAPIERAGIRVEDSDWKTHYLEACESPAESSFLTAMISSFSLRPNNGVLKAPGLTLNMQIKMGRYRLDFLANDWLVIEIDGVAYHSSPQAVARDKTRDEYFHSYDYTVLRIPAKTVFNTPSEAVRMVGAALAEGRRPPSLARTTAQKPVSVLAAVGGFVRATGDFAQGVNAYVEQASAIQKAMSKPQLIFHAEKQAVRAALEHADGEIEVEKFRAQSPEHRELFDQSRGRIQALLDEKRKGSDPHADLRRIMKESISLIQEPKSHPTDEIDEAIKRQYTALLEERATFFQETGLKLRADERRRRMVKAKLIEMGCTSCWEALA